MDRLLVSDQPTVTEPRSGWLESRNVMPHVYLHLSAQENRLHAFDKFEYY